MAVEEWRHPHQQGGQRVHVAEGQGSSLQLETLAGKGEEQRAEQVQSMGSDSNQVGLGLRPAPHQEAETAPAR